MSVTAFQDLRLADREREWDGSTAEKRVRKWAGAQDEPNEKYRDAHVWYDKDNFTAYKLLILGDQWAADGGARGVMAAGGVMQGPGLCWIRGGVQTRSAIVPASPVNVLTTSGTTYFTIPTAKMNSARAVRRPQRGHAA